MGERYVARSIRSRLLLLVLSLLLPTAFFSFLATYVIFDHERRFAASGAMETARALSLVVDREIAFRAGILSTLAASPALDAGDLRAFHAQAKAAVPNFENSIVLLDVDGQQLLNTRVPYASVKLPFSSIKLEHGSEARDVEVSDLYFAPFGKAFSFAVRQPVVRDGKVRWYIAMGSYASQLQRLFEQQPLPKGWTGSVLDAKGKIVARNIDSANRVGQSATPDMLARLAAETEGVHETQTLDGVPVLTVFTRAPESGWAMLIGLPKAQTREAALRALGMLLIAFLLLTGLGVLGAVHLSRTIAGPVSRLKAHAQGLGRGEPVVETPTGLIEVDIVQRSLARASDDLRAADQRMRDQVRDAVAETERAQAAILNAQRLEALGRLTGGIAHDFNNLLQTMTNGVKLALVLVKDGQARGALTACERAVGRAVKLTRQLLTFASLQPGNLQVVRLHDQLPALRELLQGALRESVEVIVNASPDVHPVELDPVQLELAILNLALNSRDAMPGGGTLGVHVVNRRLGPDEVAGVPMGDYVEIIVTDTGMGIPKEVQSRVFEPFFTTKPVGKGTGLGLAQVYGFAKQLGGGVSLNSVPGVGTEVSLFLAASRDSLPPVKVLKSQEPASYRGTVLLVEDDSLVRGTTAASLESRGYTVLVASTAADALAIVSSRSDINIVVSDVVMPGGASGIDLLDELERMKPGLSVVLVSGYANTVAGDLRVPIIAKPYDVDELAALLWRQVRAKAVP